MLGAYCVLKTKLKTIADIKEALYIIWGNLIDKTVEKLLK